MTDDNYSSEKAALKKAADDILKNAAAEDAASPPEEPSQAEDTAPDAGAMMEDLRDKLMRALADAENTRRRAERDKDDAYKYANTRFARDLLSVADNFRRAFESIGSETQEGGGEAMQNFLDGIAITERELLSVFDKHGIKAVAPAQGDKFDPNVHQAIAEVPGTDQPNGTIFQVTQVGYTIEDRLLRPAMVLVAKGGAPGPVDTSDQNDA